MIPTHALLPMLTLLFLAALPTAAQTEATSSTQPEEQTILIELKANGDVLVDGQSVTADGLGQHLEEGHEISSQTKVRIKADPAINFLQVRNIVQICQKVGLQSISLATSG